MGTEQRRWTHFLTLWPSLGIVLLVLVGIVSLGSGNAAHAQDEPAQSITGRVQNRYLDDDGKRVIEPVPDVRIVVEDREPATPSARPSPTPRAKYTIGLDDPGSYIVRIDLDTLPEGLTPDEGKDEQTADVGGNQNVDPGVLPRARTPETSRASGACCPRPWPTASSWR